MASFRLNHKIFCGLWLKKIITQTFLENIKSNENHRSESFFQPTLMCTLSGFSPIILIKKFLQREKISNMVCIDMALFTFYLHSNESIGFIH
jgi:hypothetical protein